MYNQRYSKESQEKPINVYAITKMMGEIAAATIPNHVILRTNFYGWGKDKPSFSDWLIQTISARKPITLFKDVYFSPLYQGQLLEIIMQFVNSKHTGIFNVGVADRLSKKNFAFLLAEKFGLDASYAEISCSTKFNFKAKRPLDMSMDSRFLAKKLGIHLPTIKEGIEQLYFDQKITSIGVYLKHDTDVKRI